MQAPNSASTGSVAVFGSDSPICDVVSFKVTITGLTLTPQGGGAPVSVITSANSVTVDFAALMDFSTILSLASVPTGTFTKATLTLSSPQLTVLQFNGSTLAPTTIPTTLTSSTVTVDIDPPLTVSTAGSTGLTLEFNLRKSVQTDAQGQVTGQVNPVFKASAISSLGDNDKDDLDDLKGLVQSVSTTSSNPSFIGSFVIQSEGKTLTIQVTSKTKFEGVTALSGLTAGTFVEVEAFVDSNNNIVAKEVEVEEKAEQQKAAFVGLITSVTRNTSGQVTQFNLFLREKEPEDNSCAPSLSLVRVSVGSGTTFKITAMGVNRAGFGFDSTALGQGQAVVVHGTCQAGSPPTVTANAIFLRLQTILGNFSARLAVAADGKTGGFRFIPCGVAFQGSGPLTVLTFSQTAFADVADLNALTATPTLAVKGLLFYETHAVALNGVSITGTATLPVAVLVAKQVHQLQ